MEVTKQKAVLKKIADTGAANSVTAVSRLAGKKVQLKVSHAGIISIDKLPKLIKGPGEIVVGVYSSISGDLDGNVIIIFSKNSALVLSSLLQGRKKLSENLTKADQLALKGLGEILSASYLNAVSDFLKIKEKHTKPSIVSTFGESMDDIIFINIKKKTRRVLLIKTSFIIPKTNIKGDYTLVLALKSVDHVLNLLREAE